MQNVLVVEEAPGSSLSIDSTLTAIVNILTVESQGNFLFTGNFRTQAEGLQHLFNTPCGTLMIM